MIKILPAEIANRIAAGEVVERPASVVRELLDNAIDAGAKRIDIEIEQGGLHSIRVTDDGCGMPPEDAALCIQRHATSKIQKASDLNAITTKGFRGEALAAISSVAKFELRTRTPSQEWGTQVIVEGGHEKTPQQIGTPVGTSVTISDLFFNTPARRKFLKKPATEMNHVLSTVTWNALANESIHFTFTHNGRRSLDLPPVTSRAERIQQVFGKKVLDDLIPVHLDTPVASLTGFISRPTLTRNGAQHIFFFVNDRYIKDRLLHRAVMNGYRNLIHSGRYPVVFLFLEINPAEIDINVHPTKQEIKFSREDAIFSTTYGAIRQAWDIEIKAASEHPRQPLRQPPLETDAPPDESKPVQPGSPTPPVTQPLPSHETAEKQTPASKPASIQQLNRETAAFIQPIQESKTDQNSIPPAPPVPTPSPFKPEKEVQQNQETIISKNLSPSPSGITESALRDLIHVNKKPDTLFDTRSLEESGELVVLGQMMNSYILAEGIDGLYIIDQHAAHERLLFEQFLQQSEKAPLVSQTLLFPLTLDFPPDEVHLVEEISDLLNSLGFHIEPFGGSSFVIRSIPSTLDIEEAEQFIKDFLGEVRHEGHAHDNRDKALHTLACRAAVKFGDPLTPEEMKGIIQGLQNIPRRNVCPHGRPAILFIGEKDLLKSFKRLGF